MKLRPSFPSSAEVLRSTLTSLPRAARLEPVLKSAARRALSGYPALYRACSASYSFVRFLPLFMRKAVRRRVSGRGAHGALQDGGQGILNWHLDLPKLNSPTHFLEWLDLNGIQFQVGGHAIYIPPQDKLVQIFGEVVQFYPEGTGFKVLKNFGLATDVDYIHGHRGIPVRRKLVGNLSERLLVANFLHMHGLGPRVWDLSNWHGEGTILSVFAVEHVSGPEAERKDSVAFLEELAKMVEAGDLEVLQPNWRASLDFSLPSCNHNLLYSSLRGAYLYVDFQNFGIPDREAILRRLCAEKKEALHFGQGRFFRDQRYLYQSVPSITDGKRDTNGRWQFLKSQLATHGISVKSRTVLDVGCNAGMIIESALREGALWAFGWDFESVTHNANDLLLMLGATRFTLTGAQLNESYPLEEDIPDRFRSYLNEAVVFYLSVSNQVGYLKSLYKMPWRVLVYEGHQSQSEKDIAHAAWANFGPDVELVALTRHADGDSLPRPFALFLRKSPALSHLHDERQAVLPTCSIETHEIRSVQEYC